MSILSEVVERYIGKFPGIAKASLARVIYNENNVLFDSPEQVRSIIRYLTGNSGGNRPPEPKTMPDYLQPTLPKTLDSLDWGVVELVADRVFKMADVHIPYHDRLAIEAAIKHAKTFNPDVILLNGDIADCYTVSQWLKDPTKRDLDTEINLVRQFLEFVRKEFPKARIIYKWGNHEERWDINLIKKAPELFGIPACRLENILKLADLGIEQIGEKRPIKFEQLYILHGHEFGKSVFNPVSPARGLYLRAKACAAQDHSHVTSSHSEKTVGGSLITTWSSGCLCHMHPDYARLNNWSHGWSFISSGFEFQNFKLHNSKVMSA